MEFIDNENLKTKSLYKQKKQKTICKRIKNLNPQL